MYAHSNPVSFVDPSGRSVDWTLVGVSIYQAGIFGLGTAAAVTVGQAASTFIITGNAVGASDLADTFARTFFYATLGKLTGPLTAGTTYLLANKARNMFTTLSIISNDRDVYMSDLFQAILFSEIVNPTLAQSSSAIRSGIAPGLNVNSVDSLRYDFT